MTESPAPPNILLLLPDQHRFDWMPDSPELPLRMPHLAGLVARGMRFDCAVTPSPLCAPARACLASGRDYGRCGVPDNHADYPLDQPTYYERLRSAGYSVAGVGKFDLHKATRDWGLDGSRLLQEWGFTHGIDSEGKGDGVNSGAEVPKGPYLAFLHRAGLADLHVADFRARVGEGLGTYTSYVRTEPTPLPPEAYCDTWIGGNAVRVLDELPRDRPWHLVVNFAGPHNPMDVTAQMRARWADVDFPQPVDNNQVDPKTHRAIRQNYAAMLENIDEQIGHILQVVESRGEMDRTLVVYSSDHGEMLGDHDRWAKSTYYHPSIGVPLVVAGPGVPHGTSDALIALHDLAATFVDCAGAEPLPGADARSLLPLLRRETTHHRRVVRSALRRWQAVFDGRYKLVQDGSEGGRRLLFDLREDPQERTDVLTERGAEAHRLSPVLEGSP